MAWSSLEQRAEDGGVVADGVVLGIEERYLRIGGESMPQRGIRWICQKFGTVAGFKLLPSCVWIGMEPFSQLR